MPLNTLVVDRADGLATVTLNRPKALNAINQEMRRELSEVVAEFERDPGVRVVIFTGAGDRAFMAGADISEFQTLTPVGALGFSQGIQALFTRIERLPQPTIAAVNGFALGGGCELTQVCDLVIASEQARFGQPEVNLAAIPGAGGTQRLARLVGRHRAKEICLTGDMVDAQDAYRIGLANRVVPADRLMTEARAMAEKLIAKSAVTLRLIKEAIDEGYDQALEAGLAIEAKAWGVGFATEDRAEGVAAFLEKRKAAFKGK
ncbi:MAG: enoyl-CoA hydratase/isomerase family protein [Candidatus Methylomirabilia bacterium]